MNAPQPIDNNPVEHNPDPERSVHIDWLTLSIPNAYLHEFERWCFERFGQHKNGKGLKFRVSSLKFAENAAAIYYDPPTMQDRNETFILDISGAGCSLIGDEDLVDLAMHAYKNCRAHFTRLDIAVDMRGGVSQLIEQIGESCMREENCRFKCHEPKLKYAGKKLTSHGYLLGKRGKEGSGRSVCVYDKGLEQRTMPIGEWVRWEARYANECADQAFLVYAQSNDEQRIILALDAVEFREVVPGETHVDRRPFCKWWADLRGTIRPPYIIRKPRYASTPTGFVQWTGTQVIPVLEKIRRKLEITWEDLMHVLGSPDKVNVSHIPAHAMQLIENLREGSIDDDGIEHPSIYEMLWNRTVNSKEVELKR